MTERRKRPKPTGFDPRLVLEEIASDRDASPTARVAACKALLQARIEAQSGQDVESTLTRRALALMKKDESR